MKKYEKIYIIIHIYLTRIGGICIKYDRIDINRRSKRVLDLLAQQGVASPSLLASQIGQSIQNTSSILKDLEEKELIKCITPNKKSWKEYTLSGDS